MSLGLPATIDDFEKEARENGLLFRGPCAKRRVTCSIAQHDSVRVFTAENDCANPQKVCPRAPGEGYEKCQSICQQGGHAELKALKLAQDVGVDLTKAIAYLHGHYWLCEECGRALYEAGIREVHVYLAAPSSLSATGSD